MKLSIEQKVYAALQEQVILASSQSEVAKKLGISKAHMTNLMNEEKWEDVSQKLWNSIATKLNVKSDWQTAETQNFAFINALCHQVQKAGIARILSHDAGSGKSYALMEYAKNHSNVFYFQCEPHYSKKDFLKRLGKSMGIKLDGNIADMLDGIIDYLSTKTQALIILDEFDKAMTKGVYGFFKTLYDALKNSCGFILAGANALEIILKKKVDANKLGFVELFSRCGNRFENLSRLSRADIIKICKANDIDATGVKEISKELGGGDLRELKDLIIDYQQNS